MDNDRDRIGAAPQTEEERRRAGRAPVGTSKRNLWPILLAILALIVLAILLTRSCADRNVDEGTPMTTAAGVDPATTTTGMTGGTATAYERGTLATYLAGADPLPATYELSQVNFASGSAELEDAANAEITDVAAALQGKASARIALRGYADPEGDAAANQALSERRAEAVRAALVEAGAQQQQIELAALGETGNAATRKNRRVEMTVTAR